MFLNDNQYFYVYLYWGKSPVGHICPIFAFIESITNNIFNSFSFVFFHFTCTLVQLSRQNFLYKYFYIPGLIHILFLHTFIGEGFCKASHFDRHTSSRRSTTNIPGCFNS